MTNLPSDYPYARGGGAGGACSKHGVYIGYRCPQCAAERTAPPPGTTVDLRIALALERIAAALEAGQAAGEATP